MDLFIAIAAQIQQQAPELDVRFAWIGSGYEPEHDFNVSVWVEDQISRSGLSGQLVMLEESPEYQKLIERSTLFVVSSRLDPLPNVAIDAMLSGTPVLCFAQACGIANLWNNNRSFTPPVWLHLNCNALASKAVALLRSPQRLKQLGAVTREQAGRWFHMPTYIKKLVRLAGISSGEVGQEERDLQVLLEHQLVDREFSFPDQQISDLALNQRYLLSWRSKIRARKPFPGFHPGIYRSISQQEPGRDPSSTGI